MRYFLHLFKCRPKFQFLPRHRLLQMSLKLPEAEFVAGLKPAIFSTLFLYRVISKMYKLTAKILQRELPTRRPYIPLPVPISLDDSFDLGDHHKAADIEFPALEKHAICQVSLDYAAAVFAGRYVLQDGLERGGYFDAVATVRVLAGL
jgi:hypothetical protein